MDKAIVSQKVAEVIKKLELEYPKHQIVEFHAEDVDRWLAYAVPLRGLPLDTLIRALYIGYEVEQTPEDKVRDLYLNFPFDSRQRAVVSEVLNLLNIKIEGVNA